jgi:hypothetical protein
LKLPLLVKVARVSAVSRGSSLGCSAHGDHSRAAGALLWVNPRSRQSSAGGALGPAVIEASGGAIDKRKHGNVVIAWGRQASVVRFGNMHDA